MALDTVQKRMSAIMPGLPFRGPLVDATESGFSKGNRQAADYHYSGIEAASPGGTVPIFVHSYRRRRANVA